MFIRRRIIVSSKANSTFIIPTYTGSHAIFGDETQGYIECYSSGDLTFAEESSVDIFLIGGGSSGYPAYTINKNDSKGSRYIGGSGGCGGFTATYEDITLVGTHNIQIGSGGAAIGAGGVVAGGGGSVTASTMPNVGGTTSLGTYSVSGGSGTQGGSGGGQYSEYLPFSTSYNVYPTTGASDGDSAKGAGQGTTTKPFRGDSAEFTTPLAAGGGAGGSGAYRTGEIWIGGTTGGNYGGGKGAIISSMSQSLSGTANTGSGGGGGGYASGYSGPLSQGATGGSGIVIIRWGYNAA